ncbi:MAG: hypothetical protein JSV18_04040 [Candidatus Bathyarchaeota archaeon]|nr:MAG: hypothetical protein JSV18_04040 [Candidatus Bathyarchaeota archaeon]
MRFNRLVTLFMLTLLAAPTLVITAAQVLTVGTEESSYYPGDEVEIYGSAGVEVNVTVKVHDGTSYIFDHNVTSEEDGDYSVDFTLLEDAVSGDYVVTASTDGESAQATFTVLDPSLEELAESLIDAAEDSQENAEEAFEELEELGIDVSSEANDNYSLGIAALAEAETLFEAEDFSGAVEKAHEAIQYFGDAFQLANELIPEEPPEESHEDDDDDDFDGESLAAAIERANVYWERLNDTVTHLEEEGFNIINIEEILDEILGHLDAASEYVQAGNHTGAVEEFRRARTVMGRVHGYLQSRMKERKEKQAEQFLEQFQRRIQNINGTLERLRERLEEGKTSQVKGALEATARKLNRIRSRLTIDDLEDLLDELEEAVEEIEEELDQLNGEGYSNQIKSMNRVEARIRVLNKTAEKLARKGWDISNVQDELNDAEGLLEDLKKELELGNLDIVGDLLEEAEECFKQVRKNLQRSKAEQNKERVIEKIWEKLQSSKDKGSKSNLGP